MPPTLKIFTIGLALLLSFSSFCWGQYEHLPLTHEVLTTGPVSHVMGSGTYGHQHVPPASYPSSSWQAQAVNDLYLRNSEKPMGGLFANGFTRTLTLLGGWNFLDSINSDESIEGTESLVNSDPVVGDLTGGALESETGYAISFAFGRRHNHRLRSEIELAIRANDTSVEFEPSAVDDVLENILPPNDEDAIRAYSIMKNFIWDFNNASRLTPYLGAGLGWSYLDLQAPSIGTDEGTGAFSYQGIGGVGVRLNKAVDFIVEYRFLGTSAVELDGVSDSFAYRTHNLFLGVKYEY